MFSVVCLRQWGMGRRAETERMVDWKNKYQRLISLLSARNDTSWGKRHLERWLCWDMCCFVRESVSPGVGFEFQKRKLGPVTPLFWMPADPDVELPASSPCLPVCRMLSTTPIMVYTFETVSRIQLNAFFYELPWLWCLFKQKNTRMLMLMIND